MRRHHRMNGRIPRSRWRIGDTWIILLPISVWIEEYFELHCSVYQPLSIRCLWKCLTRWSLTCRNLEVKRIRRSLSLENYDIRILQTLLNLSRQYKDLVLTCVGCWTLIWIMRQIWITRGKTSKGTYQKEEDKKIEKIKSKRKLNLTWGQVEPWLAGQKTRKPHWRHQHFAHCSTTLTTM